MYIYINIYIYICIDIHVMCVLWNIFDQCSNNMPTVCKPRNLYASIIIFHSINISIWKNMVLLGFSVLRCGKILWCCKPKEPHDDLTVLSGANGITPKLVNVIFDFSLPPRSQKYWCLVSIVLASSIDDSMTATLRKHFWLNSIY